MLAAPEVIHCLRLRGCLGAGDSVLQPIALDCVTGVGCALALDDDYGMVCADAPIHANPLIGKLAHHRLVMIVLAVCTP